MSVGRILYYILWPFIWFYSPLNARVRVIIVHKDECLQVTNWFGSGKWSLPGGGMKFGENPVQTGIREVNEELSVKLDENTIIQLTEEGVVHYSNGLLKRNYFLFVRVGSKPQPTLSKEITKTRWVKLDNISLPEQIRQRVVTL